MATFADRAQAGRQLAAALESWRASVPGRSAHDTDALDGMPEGAAPAVVFGIPRGGVVVAAEVARLLGLPLAVTVVRKLGSPFHEEYAVGAIAEDVRVVHDDALRAGRVTAAQLAAVEDRERTELARRSALFGTGLDVAGRTAIVIDDGIATGATAIAACRSLRARGAKTIVLATPVAPLAFTPDDEAVDHYVCLHRPRDFWAVGQYYDDFQQTSDDEVLRLLEAARP